MFAIYDRQFRFAWGFVELTIDPSDIMLGVAWGEADIVLKIPFVVVCMEWFDAK